MLFDIIIEGMVLILMKMKRGHYDDMNIIAQDAYEIAQTLHGSNNNIPYIVLGHSMGSIIARLFVENIQTLRKV